MAEEPEDDRDLYYDDPTKLTWRDLIRSAPANQWVTAIGQWMPIRKLKSSHLRNILNMIVARKFQLVVGLKRMQLLEAEANRRGFERRYVQTLEWITKEETQ